MSIENRLKQMKIYLEEALKSPEENKLYIEDLKLSISHFEANIATLSGFKVAENNFALMNGFAIDS